MKINIDLIVNKVAENIVDSSVRDLFISFINKIVAKRKNEIERRGKSAFDPLAMYRAWLETYTGLFESLRYLDDYKVGVVPKVKYYMEDDIRENDNFIMDVITIKMSHLLNAKIEELTPISDVPEESIFSGFTWDDKTEICEMIQALYLSKRIYMDGKPTTKKALKEVFEKLFNTDLTHIDSLLNAKAQSAKQSIDKEHFMEELSQRNAEHFQSIINKTPRK